MHGIVDAGFARRNVQGSFKGVRKDTLTCPLCFYLWNTGLETQVEKRPFSPPPPPTHPRKTFGSFSSSLFYLGNGKKLLGVFFPKTQIFSSKSMKKISKTFAIAFYVQLLILKKAGGPKFESQQRHRLFERGWLTKCKPN